jgi:hypothetical protein
MPFVAEIWRPVPNEPLLEASSFGRVRSLDYLVRLPNGGTRTTRLKPTYGYWNKPSADSGHRRKHVMFRRRIYRVARLVCMAFHGLPPVGKPLTLHEDEDTANNRPRNVYWGSQRENLNAPGYLTYCRSRSGENSTHAIHRARVQPVAS